MCGRVVTASGPEELSEYLGVDAIVDVLDGPDHNVAPSGRLPLAWDVVDGERLMGTARWGLVPRWAKDPSFGERTFNARAETAAEQPSYRVPLRKRRCLVPSNGFYEWKREGDRKQPYCIRAVEGSEHEGLFALAGLWESWRGGDESLETFTILTTTPNNIVAPIHDRMPVIIQPKDYNLCLNQACAQSQSKPKLQLSLIHISENTRLLSR